MPGQIIGCKEQLIIDASHKGAVIAFFKGNSAVQFYAVIQHQRAVLPAAVLQRLFYGVLAGADGVEPGQTIILSSQHQADAQPVAIVKHLPQRQGVGGVGTLGSGFHRFGVFVQLLAVQRGVVILSAAVQPAEQAAHHGQLLGHGGNRKVHAAQRHHCAGRGSCRRTSPVEMLLFRGHSLGQLITGGGQHAVKFRIAQRFGGQRLLVQSMQKVGIKIIFTHGCALPSRSVRGAAYRGRGLNVC